MDAAKQPTSWLEQGITVRILGPGFGRSGKIFNFPRPFARIGRFPANDIRIDSPNVSRWHVYLQLLPEGVFFVDLGSRSGVIQKGKRVAHGWMSATEPLLLPPYQLFVETDKHGDETNPLVKLPASSDPLVNVQLNFVNPAGAAFHHFLRRRLTIMGRFAPSKLRLDDPTIARAHLAYYRTESELFVINLVGIGAYCQGQPLVVNQVKHGDICQLGCFTLQAEFVRRRRGDQSSAHEDESQDDDLIPSRAPASFSSSKTVLGKAEESLEDSSPHLPALGELEVAQRHDGLSDEQIFDHSMPEVSLSLGGPENPALSSPTAMDASSSLDSASDADVDEIKLRRDRDVDEENESVSLSSGELATKSAATFDEPSGLEPDQETSEPTRSVPVVAGHAGSGASESGDLAADDSDQESDPEARLQFIERWRAVQSEQNQRLQALASLINGDTQARPIIEQTLAAAMEWDEAVERLSQSVDNANRRGRAEVARSARLAVEIQSLRAALDAGATSDGKHVERRLLDARDAQISDLREQLLLARSGESDALRRLAESERARFGALAELQRVQKRRQAAELELEKIRRDAEDLAGAGERVRELMAEKEQLLQAHRDELIELEQRVQDQSERLQKDREQLERQLIASRQDVSHLIEQVSGLKNLLVAALSTPSTRAGSSTALAPINDDELDLGAPLTMDEANSVIRRRRFKMEETAAEANSDAAEHEPAIEETGVETSVLDDFPEPNDEQPEPVDEAMPPLENEPHLVVAEKLLHRASKVDLGPNMVFQLKQVGTAILIAVSAVGFGYWFLKYILRMI